MKREQVLRWSWILTTVIVGFYVFYAGDLIPDGFPIIGLLDDSVAIITGALFNWKVIKPIVDRSFGKKD